MSENEQYSEHHRFSILNRGSRPDRRSSRTKSRRTLSLLVAGAVFVWVVAACTVYSTYQYGVSVGTPNSSGFPANFTMYSEATSQIVYVWEYPCHASISCTESALSTVSTPGSIPVVDWSASTVWQMFLFPSNGGTDGFNDLLYAITVQTHNQLIGDISPCIQMNITVGVEVPPPIGPFKLYYPVSWPEKLVHNQSGECRIGTSFQPN